MEALCPTFLPGRGCGELEVDHLGGTGGALRLRRLLRGRHFVHDRDLHRPDNRDIFDIRTLVSEKRICDQ